MGVAAVLEGDGGVGEIAEGGLAADVDVKGLLAHVGEVVVCGHLIPVAFDYIWGGADVVWGCFEDLGAALWRCYHHSRLGFERDGYFDVIARQEAAAISEEI